MRVYKVKKHSMTKERREQNGLVSSLIRLFGDLISSSTNPFEHENFKVSYKLELFLTLGYNKVNIVCPIKAKWPQPP